MHNGAKWIIRGRALSSHSVHSAAGAASNFASNPFTRVYFTRPVAWRPARAMLSGEQPRTETWGIL